MNSNLSGIEPLVLDGIQIAVEDGIVRFDGTISMRNPYEEITPYLRRVHAAAIESGAKAVIADFKKLRFMNSSSIRCIVDWVEWIRTEPAARRYVLQVVTNASLSWQSTTFSAIQSLGGEHVSVRAVA